MCLEIGLVWPFLNISNVASSFWGQSNYWKMLSGKLMPYWLAVSRELTKGLDGVTWNHEADLHLNHSIWAFKVQSCLLRLALALQDFSQKSFTLPATWCEGVNAWHTFCMPNKHVTFNLQQVHMLVRSWVWGLQG